MMSLNRVTLIGNVGKDPDIRAMQNGSEVATINLATSESWTDKKTNERKSRTEWHRVVVFNSGLVGVIKSYVKKGSKLYVEGSLQTRKFTDSNGIEKYSTEVVLQAYGGQIIILDSRKHDSGDSQIDDYQNDLEADIPF